MDLNILISTIMTSTAALVAIIGGFLVSRVITLSGEKNAIQKKILEIEKEIEIKSRLLKSSVQKVEDEEIDDFVRYYAEDILFKGKTVESILEEDQSIKLNKELLDYIVVRMEEILDIIIEFINDTNEDEFYNDFDEFVRQNNIKIEKDRGWYKYIFNLFISQGGVFIEKFKPIIESQEYRSNVNKVKIFEDEIKVLKALKSAEEDMLQSYGKVSGLWGGLGVLIYACVVGIIVPSFLLPYPMGIYDDVATRGVLLGLFISELVILFVYLGFSMYKLTEHKNRT